MNADPAPRPPARPPRAAVLVAACLAAFVGSARGQDDVVPPPDASVYVRDSGVAVEKLALAERLVRQKEWDKAADVYLDVAQKFADRVVPSRKDDQGKPTQYVSTADVVQDRIAHWPAEGLAAYRRRFEDTARDLLNSDDPGAPGRVMDLYFATDAGRDAALKVMAAAFERGEPATAAAVGRRLLDTHPGLLAERPRVLLQTGLAEHLAGRDDDAGKRLAELKAKFPDALARVAGTDTKAGDALAAALATPAPEIAFRSDDWPSAFGTPDADAVPTAVSEGGARLFSVDLPPAVPRGGNVGNYRGFQQTTARDRRAGLMTGVLPSVDGGTLFFQDNARVYAIGLASGLPLPGWQQTYPGAARGAFAIDAAPTPRGKQLAVAVSGQSVVALLGQIDLSVLQLGYPQQQQPQIVCLDRDTGRRTWATSPQRLALPDDQGNLRDGTFYGTPVVDGDTVYALVNANRGNQFEECYLIALRLSDGKFKWSTYVASTSLGNRQYEGDGDGNFTTGTAATLSMSGGRLYVLTNLGALACLDAASGHVRWLNVYPRTPNAQAQRQRTYFQPRMAGKPFTLSPPMVIDGRVFALPVDAASLFVVDAIDGSTVREIPRKLESKFPDVQCLVGVIGDSVVLSNASTVFKLSWSKYDAGKTLLQNDARYKNFPAGPDDKGDASDSVRGRPFLAAKSVLVTTTERLYRVSLDTFKTVAEYPPTGKWDDEESPGNVLATPENLILAGPSRVTVYADLAVATGKLDARLAADPNDVDASQRYAELLFAAGQPKPALARLDEAAAKLGGLNSLTPGPARDRLFEIATNFGAKLQKNEAEADLAAEVYARAAAAARTPLQQVRYRMARAAGDHVAGHAADEIALYQEILANPEWRAAQIAGRSGVSTAGAEAETAVADLLRGHGPELYAAYETAAAERLAKLQQAAPPDADALVELSDEFPAAKSSPDALSLAADRYEAADQPRRATQTLRRLLQRDLSNERRQVTLQALARNYLRSTSQIALAQVRLNQARKLAPAAKLIRPLSLPDGKPMAATTVAEAAAALDGYYARASAEALPKLGAPITSDGSDPTKPPLKPAAEVAAAAAIVNQQADLARNDRVVVWGTDRRIGVVAGESGGIKWTEASPAVVPIAGGFVGETLVVIMPNEAIAIDPAGKVLWKTTLNAMPALDLASGAAVARDSTDDGPVIQPGLVRDPRVFRRPFINGRFPGRRPVPVAVDTPDEDATPGVERFTQARLLSDRVVLATSTGRVAALDLATGKSAWQSRVSETGATKLLSNDDFVAAGFIDPGNGSDVYVFDAVTGQTVLHKPYTGDNNPQAGGLINLALSPDGVLITMLAGRLSGVDLYDLGSGDWRYDPAVRPNNGGQPTPFQVSNYDGQLVIAADRVLAVYMSTTGQQSVHAYALRTLKPVMTHDPRSKRDVELSYGPRASDPDGNALTIAASGRLFYLIGQKSLAGYDLDRDDAGWADLPGAGDKKPTRDVILTRDFVIQIAPTAMSANPDRLPGLLLSMYGRTPAPSGKESGALEQRPAVNDPAGVIAGEWQVVDGAFYYVSGDQKLKVLRANP